DGARPRRRADPDRDRRLRVAEYPVTMAEQPGGTAIREWRQADASALVRLADDKQVWLGLRDAFPHPYGLGDALSFIALAGRMHPPTFFAIEVDGALAGGTGYTCRTDVERIGAEVGHWLGRPFR